MTNPEVNYNPKYPEGYQATLGDLLADAVKKIDRRIKNQLGIVTLQSFEDELTHIGDEIPGIGDS